MKTATISETKNQLSALLDRVRHGETILITDRSQPVARLEPVVSASGAGPDEGRLDGWNEQVSSVARAMAASRRSCASFPPPPNQEPISSPPFSTNAGAVV
jgi:prevent-host-death family protein